MGREAHIKGGSSELADHVGVVRTYTYILNASSTTFMMSNYGKDSVPSTFTNNSISIQLKVTKVRRDGPLSRVTESRVKVQGVSALAPNAEACVPIVRLQW